MLAEAYQKYIYFPRPVSNRHPMDVRHRAKQFAPFAALRGLNETVRKQEIRYESRKTLSEEQKAELDLKLRMLRYGLKVHVTYFQESPESKNQGQYVEISGTVEFFDPAVHLRIEDTIVSIPDICELTGEVFDILETPC